MFLEMALKLWSTRFIRSSMRDDLSKILKQRCVETLLPKVCIWVSQAVDLKL